MACEKMVFGLLCVCVIALVGQVGAECITPSDDLYINGDTVLCGGEYIIDDVNFDGVIIINQDNVKVTCQGTVIKSLPKVVFEAQTMGLVDESHNFVVVEGCVFSGFGYGAWINGANAVTLIDNTFDQSSKGGILLNEVSGAILDGNTVTWNGLRDWDGYGVRLFGNGVENGLKNNFVCFNSLDISKGSGGTLNKGMDNTCDTTSSNWADVGTSGGCTNPCPINTGDPDGDGVVNAYDNCWGQSNVDQADDGDHDCGLVSKPYTSDPRCGDACDPDRDGDGCLNGNDKNPDIKSAKSDMDPYPDDCDNCPVDFNDPQDNHDSDSYGDACDNCDYYANEGQEDINNNRVGDACDCYDVLQGPQEKGVDCGGICSACVECTWCGNYIEPVRIKAKYDEKIFDIVFIPHKNYANFMGNFKDEMRSDIREGFFTIEENSVHRITEDYRDRFNFYYYKGGYGDWYPGGPCAGILPYNFFKENSWADTAGILYMGDGPPPGCTTGNYFVSGWFPNLVMHETMHATFDLVDEYCGNTAYSQKKDSPNVWETKAGCQADASTEGWLDGTCRQIMADDPSTPQIDCQKNFWRYDPDTPTHDFMTACWGGCNHAFVYKEADVRKINQMFNALTTTHSRGVLLEMNINNGIFSSVSSEVVEAHPDVGLYDGPFEIVVSSPSGGVIASYRIRDPRISLGGQVPPYSVFDNDVTFTDILPFYDNLKTVEVVDVMTQKNMLTVDLTETLTSFCTGTGYSSEECQSLDLDDDGVPDSTDKCPGTALPEVFAKLNPNNYGDIDGDRIFEVGSAKGYADSTYTLAKTYGCSCQQILAQKPGNNEGEKKFGCTKGTIENYIRQNR